jgi:SH3-like domain-containing protein
MKLYKTCCLIFCIFGIASICSAGVVPRFSSIKPNEVNLRAGPSKNYPIKWVIKNKGEPVEVITEFEQWREIKDKDGDSGWVHETMLSGNRYVVIIGDTVQFLYKNAGGGKKIAKIEPNVRARFITCKEEWCYISFEKYKGWIKRELLWGVRKDEKFE